MTDKNPCIFTFSKVPQTSFAFKFSDKNKPIENPYNHAVKQQAYFLETEVHPWLDFRTFIDNPNKAVFRTRQGQFYGIKLVNQSKQSRFNFHTMAKLGLQYNPYSVFEQTLNTNDTSVFFMSLLKNRLSS